jgi:uncharacterized GH25 family protein
VKTGKAERFTVYFRGTPDNITGNISATEAGDSLQLALFDEGTTLLAFQSANKFIQLDSAKFNEYLEEDGLTEAIQYRNNHQETDSAGREYYQRSVKTIVQVGAGKENISHPTFLPLDIIPLANPYHLAGGQSLTVKVLFQKKPLPNQLVKVWQRINNTTTKTDYTTNEKGEINFPIQARGKWMVSTVEMQRLENDPVANWQSFWGSCTWGYE